MSDLVYPNDTYIGDVNSISADELESALEEAKENWQLADNSAQEARSCMRGWWKVIEKIEAKLVGE